MCCALTLPPPPPPLQIAPSIGELLFTQSWNFRLGTVGLDPATILQVAAQRGIDANTIPAQVTMLH